MKTGEILDRLDHAEDTGRIGRAVVRAIRDHLHASIDNRIRLEKELAFFQGLAEHAPLAAQMGADGDVFEHAHAVQQLDVLEAAAHAHSGDLAGIAAGDGLAEKQHLAGRG